jgi:hypothetical protein
MSEYNAKVYMKQGGDELVVAAGGKITAAGTQASHIADLGDSATGAQIAAAVNAILKALEDVGILKSS